MLCLMMMSVSDLRQKGHKHASQNKGNVRLGKTVKLRHVVVDVAVDHRRFVGSCGFGHRVHGDIPSRVSTVGGSDVEKILTRRSRPRTTKPIQWSMPVHRLHRDDCDRANVQWPMSRLHQLEPPC